MTTTIASLKILVVDDDPGMRETLAHALAHKGHKLFTAHDGKEAIKILELSQDFDLVISDFNMPAMNGAELNLSMRAQGLHQPFILCTGSPEMISRELLHKLDLYAFMAKPYTLEEIEELIDSIATKKFNTHITTNKKKAGGL